jgi:hypothetical protein
MGVRIIIDFVVCVMCVCVGVCVNGCVCDGSRFLLLMLTFWNLFMFILKAERQVRGDLEGEGAAGEMFQKLN